MDKILKIIVISVLGLLALFVGVILLFESDEKELHHDSLNNIDSRNIITDSTVYLSDNYNTGESASKPAYRLYFENSGSMDGYVEGQTRLKNTLFDLMTNIQTYGLTDQVIEKYYLNTIIIPRKENLRNFIYNLDRINFRNAGGNRGQTNMAEIFELVLGNATSDNVSIMVSDCILSPDSGRDASDFLNQHRIQIRQIFSEHLTELAFNTKVLRLNSNFNGLYYNQFGVNTWIESQARPYFIWIFGQERYLKELENILAITSLLQEDLTNTHSFNLQDEGQIKYSILPNPRIGSFIPNMQNPRSIIDNARASRTGHHSGIFEFSIGIDFSGFHLGEEYYANPANYDLSSSYSLEIVPSTIPGYTHLLKLRTDNLRNEFVLIRLRNRLPEWIEEFNLDDDTNILSPEKISKTFGVKYLFNGVHEGYLTNSAYNEYFFVINITINT